MIEITVRDYLLTKLTVPVYAELPPDPPDLCVTLEQTGGADAGGHLYEATVAVRSYGPGRAQAMRLNDGVIRAMRGLDEVENVSRCSLMASYNNTNPTTKKHRYQAVFNIYYMEAE